ncbi:MAG: TlyA family RNA methyltransferase [Proteobacteria bacterium]|nr:TlyA family RNA methyltransferase [Pseudomonadota bacterium]MBU1639355.1 TlyA family RNA methyltransferase [Pseudomonadota bacterium]
MKIRLDKLLVARGLVESRQKAQAIIGSGQVLVAGHMVDKVGSQVDENQEIIIKGKACPFVSRGGLKLAKGLEFFHLDPCDLICADIGASTGGFTDCLLQNGATLVYAVDVGYGQLDWKLRQDPRVVVLERTNARYLTHEQIPQALDLAVIDAAFISIKLLIPALLPLFAGKPVSILSLIKPQFEVGKGKVGKGGVVSDPALHNEVVESIKEFITSLGLTHNGVTDSPILGPKGNKEFLIHIVSKE